MLMLQGMSKENLEEPSLMELARVITAGLCIEASFKRGKGEVGMDEYKCVPGRVGTITWC